MYVTGLLYQLGQVPDCHRLLTLLLGNGIWDIVILVQKITYSLPFYLETYLSSNRGMPLMESNSFFPFHSTCLLPSDFTFRWLAHQLAMALLAL